MMRRKTKTIWQQSLAEERVGFVAGQSPFLRGRFRIVSFRMHGIGSQSL